MCKSGGEYVVYLNIFLSLGKYSEKLNAFHFMVLTLDMLRVGSNIEAGIKMVVTTSCSLMNVKICRGFITFFLLSFCLYKNEKLLK